jgi:ATP-dependent Clp protease protease subunit
LESELSGALFWRDIDKPGYFVDVATHLLASRTIFIGSELDDRFGSHIVMQLLAMGQQQSEPIVIYLNSYGGSVPAGLGIVDMIGVLRSNDVPVHTYCLGECIGIASVILASGEPGQRRAFPHSRISLFQEWQGMETLYGSSTEGMTDERTRLTSVVHAVLERATRLEADKLGNHMGALYFMEPKEAVEAGVIDAVVATMLPNRAGS